MFADWQLSMRVKRDPQTLNLPHRSSQTEEPHWAPTLLFPLIWTSAGVGLSLCADQRESIKQTREHRNEPEVMLWSLLLLCYFHIWTLHAECSDQSGATLIADGSGAGSSERDTTCDCRRSEFFHIKLEKCVFVHVFISAECVWTSHCCAQEQTQSDVCLSVTAQCCSACSPQTVTVSETITEVIEKQPGNVPIDWTVHRQLHQNMQWADSGPLALCLTPHIRCIYDAWTVKLMTENWTFNLFN